MPSYFADRSLRSVELRLRRDAWESAVQQLQVHGGVCAIGDMRRHRGDERMLLLVDRLEVPLELPDGRRRPPLDERCVVMLERAEDTDPAEVVRSLQPQPSQMLAVVLLSRTQPDRCRMCVFEDGLIRPLDQTTVVGQGMLTLHPANREPAEFDAVRASRTRGALGATLHERLQAAAVTLVGLGRNGCTLAFLLAGLGVGRLRLLDPDVVGLENLDGMPGLTVEDVGLPKVAAVARRLAAFRPELGITCLDTSALDPAAEPLLDRSCDLYVTTVDDDAPRLAISLLANRTLTPHLDIGTAIQSASNGHELTADIRLLLPGMCVSCLGGLADPEATLYDISAPTGSLHRGPRLPWSTQRAGSLAHWNALTCGVAIEQWLSLLRGETGASWTRLTRPPTGDITITTAPVAGAATCPYCRAGSAV